MKTKTPDFSFPELEKTPDYSPHVMPVRLPFHIRECGRELIAVHAAKRCLGEMASSFHTSEDVFEKLVAAPIIALFSHSPNEEIVTARVVSDEVAPFVFRDNEDEYEVEDLIYRFPVEEKVVRTSASGVIEKPMMFFDDEPLCEDSDDFPLLLKHRLPAQTTVKNATLSHFEPDEGASE